jgi:integrase
MPAKSKGAHLWFKPPRMNKGYREKGVWLIKDGRKNVSTGCGKDEIGAAEKKLAEYIAETRQSPRSERDIVDISLADVLTVYVEDRTVNLASSRTALSCIGRLNEFFGAMALAEVNGRTCREYAASRLGKGHTNKGEAGGARRDLQVLSAAINHHARLGLHRGVVKVLLPPKGEARQRWLTREEMAKLLWTCWRTRGGGAVQRYPLRHLTRLLLLGAYTGSRPGAIFSASWFDGPGLSFIDVERGVFHRHAGGKAKTSKRQPPVRLSSRLLAHLRRWRDADIAKGQVFVVTHEGEQVRELKRGLMRACELAGVERVTPYALRHTAGAWLVSKGVSTRMVADYLGTSEKMVENHYGHLDPNYQQHVADMIGRK